MPLLFCSGSLSCIEHKLLFIKNNTLDSRLLKSKKIVSLHNVL